MVCIVVLACMIAAGCGASTMLEQPGGGEVSTGPASSDTGVAGSGDARPAAAPVADFHNSGTPAVETPAPTGQMAASPGVFPGSNGIQAPATDASASGHLVSGFLADADDGWQVLVDAEWKLAPGAEAHLCARTSVPRDVYLHEFSPLIPTGTHHTVVTVHDQGDAPNGVVACGPDVSGQQIYGSGVGTKPDALPDGIAMQVRAGQQLELNLHLFNTSEQELVGRSGTLVKTLDASLVREVADNVLAGPLGLTIPPGTVTESGQCTFTRDATIFSVGPHMHQLGVHMRVSAAFADGKASVLYDGPYSFESQQRYPIDFVQLHAGDAVRVECTYDNTTGHTVGWGQSTLDEMCFVGLRRFPAVPGASYLCTN